jgi:hypothetical protein
MTDVFISYTHIDNEARALSTEHHGWIDLFHEALELRLRQIWKRDTAIWRDPQNTGNDVLDPAIEAVVRESATLLTILSPDYLKSAWCTKELRIFCEAAESSGGLRIGNKSRIIKVIKTPVDDDPGVTTPAELRALIGYAFFRRTKHGNPFELDPRHGTEEYAEFVRGVTDVAYDVRDMLRALEGRKDGTTVPEPAGAVIYLAETSFDLSDVRDAIRRELEQFGHTVLPDAAFAHTQDYPARVREQLARARLSIHLIGANYGVIPEGAQRSIVELQYALACDRAREEPDFQAFAWLRPGTEPADAAQARFVQSLQDGAQLLNVPLEDLRVQLSESLRRAPAADGRALRERVYLAETSSDLRAEHDELRRRLQALGLTVLPEGPIPYSPEYEQRAREELAHARLSIHPIGSGYGVIPEGSERSIVELQYDLAGEDAAGSAQRTRLTWLPAATQPGSARQEAFVAMLRQDPTLLTGTLDDVEQAARSVLEPAPSPAATPGNATAARREIFVLYDAVDAAAGTAVAGALAAAGFDVNTPLFEGDERELREDLEENLRSCDAVLIYHGETTEFWLRTKLRDLQRAFGLGRRRPFVATAVMFGDPKRGKEAVRRADVLTIEGYGAFRAALLDPFAERLRRPDDSAS